MLTRESVLSGPKPKSVDVEVPALGGSVKVRQLTIGQRDEFEATNLRTEAKDYRARLVMLSTVGADGSPMFTPDDVPALSALASNVLEPIVDAAQKINRYSAEEIEALAKK